MKSRTKSIKQNLTILQPSKPRKKSQSRTQKLKPCVNSQSSFIKPPIKSNKQNEETRKYLQKTLNILSHRFNIMTGDSPNISSVLQLSTSVYKIVKENLSVVRKSDDNNKENVCVNMIGGRSKIREEMVKDQGMKNYSNHNNNSNSNNNRDSRKIIISEKQHPHKVRPSSVMANYSSILQASSICHNQSAINCQPLVALSDNSLFVKRRSNSTLDSYFRDKFGTNAEDEQAVEKKLKVIKALKKSQEIVNKSNRSHIQSSVVLNSCDVNDKSVVMDKLRGRKEEKLR